MVLLANASTDPHLHGPVEFYLSASVELWCKANRELKVRAISQDLSRKINRFPLC